MNIHIKNAKSYFSEVAAKTINDQEQKLVHGLAFGLYELSAGLQILDERIDAVEKRIVAKK
jgi:hypothetical protein